MTPSTQDVVVTSVLDMATATIKMLNLAMSLWRTRAEAAEARTIELEAQIKREDDLWVLLSPNEMVQLRFARRKLPIASEETHP